MYCGDGPMLCAQMRLVFLVAIITVSVMLATRIQSECLEFTEHLNSLKSSPHYSKCIAAVSAAADKIGFSDPAILDSALKNILEEMVSDHVDGYRMVLREARDGEGRRQMEVGLVDYRKRQGINVHVSCDEPSKYHIGMARDSKTARLTCEA